MEKQFDFGKTIRFLKNNPIIKKKNSIIEKKFDYKDKIDFEKKSILKSIFSTLIFFFFFAFASMEISRKDWQWRVCLRSLRSSIFFKNFQFFFFFGFCIYGDFIQRLTRSNPFFEVKYVKISFFKFFFFAFASMVVSLKDRQCWEPSRRLSEWKFQHAWDIIALTRS